MRSRVWACLVAAAAVLALGAAIDGCAASSNTTSSTSTSSAPGAGATSSASTSTSTTSSGAVPGGPSALSVSPTSGTPQAVIQFRFTSPAPSAAEANTQISQALSVTGPRHAGCVGAHNEAVPVGPAGQPVDVAVGPAQLGGAWCPGSYTARVEVLARPKCGAGMMCPQFIRVVAILGPVTFRIVG
ncbi:MAG: hypothetical protein ACXVUX_17085 [Solirubrobacteraceae bacterium]